MQDFGPRPTRSPNHPTPAQLRVLQAVASLGGHDVRHSQIAEAVGGHPNAVRPHLESLARLGLLDRADVRDGHRGRPPRVYRLTRDGQAALSEHPAGDGSALVGALTTFMLSAGHGADDARKVGEIWGQALDNAADQDPPSGQLRSEDPGLDRVVEVMGTLGFDPEHTAEGHRHTLHLQACPMLELARENPHFVCKIHEGLITGVLARAGTSASVHLEPFATHNACRVHIETHDSTDADPTA